MRKQFVKNAFLIGFPFLCFFIAASVLAATKPVFQQFSLKDDILIFQSDTQLRIAGKYSVANRSNYRESELALKIFGPPEGELKILVPLDVMVLAKSGPSLKEETIENLHAFIIPLHLKNDEISNVTLRYKRPFQNSDYSLFLSSGGNNLHILAEVNSFKLFDGDVTRPLFLRADFKKKVAPLRITESKFIHQNTIELFFNKTPEGSAFTDIVHFALTDLNSGNPEITDRIFIQRAELRGQKLFLYFTGMTHQAGEQYRLDIKNLEQPLVFTIY